MSLTSCQRNTLIIHRVIKYSGALCRTFSIMFYDIIRPSCKLNCMCSKEKHLCAYICCI